MPTGPQIIITLKLLVTAVTLLLAASLVALAMKKPKWHGRMNTAFFALTMLTVIVFELLIRFAVDVTSTFTPEARAALRVHLGFSIPSAILLPIMYFSGRGHRQPLHRWLGLPFLALWIGTFVTGVFGLPHD
jgi:Kef-type K+ transport system membrane component KefB